MKKIATLFYVLLMITFTAVTVYANEPGFNRVSDDPAVSMDTVAPDGDCGMNSIENASWENVDSSLPYLLQRDQKRCLDRCTQEFNSCMNGAGDSPSAKFSCGEKRWMCTRGCDNQWDSKLEL